jgi:hypothetical protein
MHIVLLGDSVLDNKAYVQANEPDVRAQLGSLLGDSHQLTRCAVDGSTTIDIVGQYDKIPKDATHLVVSIGGSDLVDQIVYVDAPANTMMESMIILSALSDQFRKQYHDTLQDILKRGLPTIICTMYNPRFDDDTMVAVLGTALQAFNDCIFQEVSKAGLPLIELRSICDSEEDFANSIELSAIGGQKVAGSIKRVLDTRELCFHM